jgi:hypothetical protein
MKNDTDANKLILLRTDGAIVRSVCTSIVL